MRVCTLVSGPLEIVKIQIQAHCDILRDTQDPFIEYSRRKTKRIEEPSRQVIAGVCTMGIHVNAETFVRL
jgi:hypothetical protein